MKKNPFELTFGLKPDNYISRLGQSSEIISSFEEEKGITVNMTTYTSPDDMLAKVQSSKAGTYDLIIAPENYAPIFSKQNLLEKLDRDKIPNYTNIDSISQVNDSIKIKIEKLDSAKNAKVIEVQTLDNDSTLKLFYELVSE